MVDLGVREHSIGETCSALGDGVEALHFNDIDSDPDDHAHLRFGCNCRLDGMNLGRTVAGRIAWIVVAALWLTAFVCNIVVPDWNWGAMDFVFATGFFAFGAASVDWISTRQFSATTRRLLIGGFVLALMAIWARLATGD